MRKTFSIGISIALLSTALAMSGCYERGGVIEVDYGPPAPVALGIVGEAPGPDYAWVDGYYRWDGGRYVWGPGEWRRRPHPGAVWVAGEWRRHGNRYRWHEGRWR